MFLLRWILNILLLILVAKIVPGVEFQSFWATVVTSVILGLLNAVIRPLLILLTLPVNILTLGLFTLVINGFVFWLASTIVRGFEIKDFASAFLAALAYAILVTIVNLIGTGKKK